MTLEFTTDVVRVDEETLVNLICSVEVANRDVTVLDPNKKTYVGYAKGNTVAGIAVSGQWCPGAGHPYWPAIGDPNTKYRGINKWSAIVVVQAAQFDLQPGPVIQAFQYPGKPVRVLTSVPFGVHISVVMNDDTWGDNTYHPTDPMRATC